MFGNLQCDTKGDNPIWLKKEMKDRWRKIRKRVLLTIVKIKREGKENLRPGKILC